MENEELVRSLLEKLMEFRKCKIHKHVEIDNFTHSQKMVMFSLHDLSRDGIVSLSDLRNLMRIAPSTLTPIITSLENDGYIVRNIDKEDRRNIYLHLSEKGKEYTNKVNSAMQKSVSDYIEFIGHDDAEELLRIISKSLEFFKEGRKLNEENI